jgi:hypothetical protein
MRKDSIFSQKGFANIILFLAFITPAFVVPYDLFSSLLLLLLLLIFRKMMIFKGILVFISSQQI